MLTYLQVSKNVYLSLHRLHVRLPAGDGIRTVRCSPGLECQVSAGNQEGPQKVNKLLFEALGQTGCGGKILRSRWK